MSNCYVRTCFALNITAAEADLLREAVAFEEFLEGNPDPDALDRYWNGLSEPFRTVFRPTGEEAVSGFLALFPDCDYPTFDTSFSFEDQVDGMVRVFAHADQFEPDAVAELLRRTVTRSLPVMVTWSYDCDRHHPDAFGGGGFMIDDAGIHWIGTSMVHDKHRFAPKFVLVTRDDEEGLVFWNSEAGFGPLEAADVVTDSQIDDMDLPITNDQPEWLALPTRLFE